ncbi:hypothetical protein MTAT_24980 [Moorella thermoacetica]|uniref:Radical SAM superfamily protein n=1 Tax=Neomoorella thermoacetica TaxID=1525 RepID=A0AAC9MSY2_NEOTH|nr:radical SAM protein [Moorella thermoacetica]AOQ22858.1 Radical SAM superfamily protein [Moorella thermoacetica]TYL10002.1 hypothetical protein MTAT_24980 [Moorella thermoacetica]
MPATSPEYVKTSTAAAITLGFQPGSFHRDARLTGLNLLLTYNEPCAGRCAYCGLSGNRLPDAEPTFIRVDWPVYALDAILKEVRRDPRGLERVCVGMPTHRRSWDDLLKVVNRWHRESDLLISALLTPTACRGRDFFELRAAGADMVGIAIDCATPELFERYRGRGVKGPHRWEEYWEGVSRAVTVFGRGRVGIHLIVGLGETEAEMIQTIQRAQDMGVRTHLFSFFPETGTILARRRQPPLGQYRRVQLARYIINEGLGRAEDMTFNDAGQVMDFGMDITPLVKAGEAFRTSGCPGKDGRTVACNRPYGNERPSQAIRNFPFAPEPGDIRAVERQLRQGLKGAVAHAG